MFIFSEFKTWQKQKICFESVGLSAQLRCAIRRNVAAQIGFWTWSLRSVSCVRWWNLTNESRATDGGDETTDSKKCTGAESTETMYRRGKYRSRSLFIRVEAASWKIVVLNESLLLSIWQIRCVVVRTAKLPVRFFIKYSSNSVSNHFAADFWKLRFLTKHLAHTHSFV